MFASAIQWGMNYFYGSSKPKSPGQIIPDNCQWVRADCYDGPKVLYRRFLDFRCGLIAVARLNGNHSAVVTWLIEDINQDKSEKYGANADSISKDCGPTFCVTLINLDDIERREELLLKRMRDLCDRFLRLTSGAEKIWENNLDWTDPLLQTVVAISRFKTSTDPTTHLPNYIRRNKIPSIEQPTLYFSLLRLPEPGGFVLRIKKEIKTNSQQKIIRTGLTYPEGLAVVRVRQHKDSRESQLWANELDAQKRIKAVDDDRYRKFHTHLKNILVPIAITQRENRAHTMVNEIILPFHTKNALEYLNDLYKQNQTLSEQQKNHLILGFAEGISELHEHVKLAHRDLKLENFMIMVVGTLPTPLLIDFDTACGLDPFTVTNFRSTKGWLPPEAVQFNLDKNQNEKTHSTEERSLEIHPVKWDSWGLFMLMQLVEDGPGASLGVLQQNDDAYGFLNRIRALNAEPMPPSNTKEWIMRQLSKEDPRERITPTEALCYLKNLPATDGCIVS